MLAQSQSGLPRAGQADNELPSSTEFRIFLLESTWDFLSQGF